MQRLAPARPPTTLAGPAPRAANHTQIRNRPDQGRRGVRFRPGCSPAAALRAAIPCGPVQRARINWIVAALSLAPIAPLAQGQSWEFDITNPVLEPGGPTSTAVTLSADPGPADYAIAGVNFHVHASEAGWSDPQSLIPTSAAPAPFSAGFITGGSVTGIALGQLAPQLGFTPNPGRIDIWGARFTVTDFASSRSVSLATETARFVVYTIDPATVPIPEIRSLIPTEGSGRITVIPAPAGLALGGLGLSGLMAARRQRRMGPAVCTRRL